MERIPAAFRWFLLNRFGGFLLHGSALLRRISTGFTWGSSSPRSCDAAKSMTEEAKTVALYPGPEGRGFTATSGNTMAARDQAHDEQAWRNAKKICQLNAQQVEMARALGMNPKKLPRLRPSPQQRWKLPVGEFIEACYRKRFGGDPVDHHQHRPEPGSRKLPIPQRQVDAPKRLRDARSQVGDLCCYLRNLADDLQTWLAQGTVAPDVLPQVIAELREIAEALETGAPIWPIPTIPVSPRRPRHVSSQQGDRERTSDDEIPF